ncbi:putative hemolysin [Rhodoferax ferrireducens]|uniref:Hemolysin n=1 Tax=Rhodoferax ferrireducens TaxID=192843 RepID=A0ABU2C8D9_9BURK|nr:hemolysin family protein [Rhodoferax ferrireducens]MDR7377600.1 putative hemolysin [Rhodoferax ferrireducens]
MDLLLIVLLTLLNGVFSMSELALASSRKARLTAMAEAGDKGALAALALLENPTQFLSSVQVGITSIGMVNGILGEAAFSDGVSAWVQQFGVAVGAADITATVIVVTVITFVTIVFGELVPKRIGQLYPELVARYVSRPMTWVATGAKPFVRLLSISTHAVLKLLRIDNAAGRSVTEEEIVASLEEGVDAGVIEEHEHQMVQNVFRLDERPLTSLMVPRTDVNWLEASHTVAQCLQMASSGGDKVAHSWYPVCRGSLDDVVGVISVGRLLELGADLPGPVEPHVLPAAFLPETLSGMELLEQFRAKSGRMVFVVDEYGVVQGLMTPRDLLEAITGELQPGAQADAWATQREDGSWLLDGLMPVSELKSRLDIKELPEEDRGRYNTVAGLLMSVSGRMMVAAESIECAGWVFEVVDLDGKRIDKVLASIAAPAPVDD